MKQRLHLQHLLCVLVLINGAAFLANSKVTVEDVKIKIVEAPALSRFPAMTGQSSKRLTLRARPSPLSGPPHLQQLNGTCYTGKDKGYTYNLCLFQNVTQKEDRTGWNSFHGVLGVWHEWIIENDTFTGMRYTLGESCGTSDREAAVIFNCSPTTKLYNFTEPKTCVYHMVMDTPLACFKGAMQVYHLLTPEQLKKWDEIEHLYYADEITYKGLTKKRREVLADAGLLQKSKKKEPTPAPTPKASSEPPSELTQCLKDKGALEENIQKMKRAALSVVKDFPEIHGKLRLLFNATSVTFTDVEGGAARGQGQDGGGARRQGQDGGGANGGGQQVKEKGDEGLREELLLSDQIMDSLVQDLEHKDEDVNERGNTGIEGKAEKDDLDALLRDMNR